MSLILSGGKIIGSAAGIFSSGGGGGQPATIAANTLFSSGQPGHLYSVAQIPSPGSSAITGFTGVLSPSGVTGSSSIFSTPVSGITARVDYHNVANVAQTATMKAVNSFGACPTASPASNSATPAAFTDTFQSANATYIGYGGSAVGMSSLWRNNYFDFSSVRSVTPGTSTTTAPGYNASYCINASAPAYPSGFGITNQQMLEVLPSQSGTAYAVLLAIMQDNPAGGNNGAFDISPYTSGYLFFLVWNPSQTTGNFVSQSEATINYQGIITGVAGSTVSDANQSLGNFNSYQPSLTALFEQVSGAGIGYTSNTSTSFNVSSGTWTVGDPYDIQIGDQAYGSAISDYATYVTAPSAGVFTAGAWNVVKVPVSAMGITGLNNNLFYKAGIGAAAPGSTGGFWLICIGWSVS